MDDNTKRRDEVEARVAFLSGGSFTRWCTTVLRQWRRTTKIEIQVRAAVRKVHARTVRRAFRALRTGIQLWKIQDAEDHERSIEAACCVQRLWRGFLGRRDFAAKQANERVEGELFLAKARASGGGASGSGSDSESRVASDAFDARADASSGD